ncbi:hypothetical protein [Sulfitobacter aestuariivivens]|uniref:DUF4402 domain-containing protein n=1 Tax=Sulfitobacter aestuariivivens TaxID=2766981 RepID=A0A927HET4_9RHOB|nr:hypothetical protein [Sulfitobacter aestuariivivens]MBD3663713.1 hypothetical protein [Sulfitobacter aestuariivivens]
MSNSSSFQSHLAVIFVGALIVSAAQAETQRNTDAIATRVEVPTSAGQNIPVGAFGFLLVERPREVNLLALRGLAGSGKVVLRTDQPGLCLSIPIRFIAGDFGGEAISGHLAEPIHFTITSRKAARALATGRDVVSDQYRVGDQFKSDADIVLQSGLDEGVGFVINPGRNILGDIFGVSTKPVSCQRV